MDEYDIIIEKTVRDWFKSNALIQIKKYKMTKEKEMMSKDDDLKKLILDKYRSLIQSISALEEISLSVNDLQGIRSTLGTNLKSLNISDVETKLKNIKFTEDIILSDEAAIAFNYDNHFEYIDSYWKEINHKDFLSIFKELILIKDNWTLTTEDNVCIISNKYISYCIMTFDDIMKVFITDSNYLGSWNVYKGYFDTFYNDILYDNELKESVTLSEWFTVITCDDTINTICKKFFHVEAMSIFSNNILIRWLLLKISEYLSLFHQCRDENFINEENIQSAHSLFSKVIGIIMIYIEYLSEGEGNTDWKKLNEFMIFIRNEISNNISSLFIMNDINKIKRLKVDEVLSFWKQIYTRANLSLDSFPSISLHIKQIPSWENSNIMNFFFMDKTIDQVKNVTSQQISIFKTDPRYRGGQNDKKDKHDNFILSTIKALSGIINDDKISSELCSNLLSTVSALLVQLLDTSIKTPENMGVGCVMKQFWSPDVAKWISSLEWTELQHKIIALNNIYTKANYNEIEKYIKTTFKQYLQYEKYSTDCPGVWTCSESWKEWILYLRNFDINQEEYLIWIVGLIYMVYETVWTEGIDTVLNPIWLVDLNILNEIRFDKCDYDFSVIIKNVENRFGIVNNGINQKELIVGKKELKIIFRKSSNDIEDGDFFLGIASKSALNQLNSLDKQSNTSTKQRELLPLFNNKLNVYLIFNTKLNSESKSNPNSNNANNSTSKWWEHRIDENYLSLRPAKPVVSPQTHQNNNNTSSATQSNTINSYQSQVTLLNPFSQFFNLNK